MVRKITAYEKSNYLSLPNRKLKKTMSIHAGVMIYSFGMPQGLTCPCAGMCKKICYAKRGMYRFKESRTKRAKNFVLSVKPEFVDVMTAEISRLSALYKNLYIRVHDTGDFYSIRYLEDWMQIARNCPDVTFYGYTKCISMFDSKKDEIPSNMVFTMSRGGTQDILITDDMKQSLIFKKKVSGDWVDGSHDDLVMLTTDRVGLVYH